MERAEKRRIVEALVLAAHEPIPAARVAAIVPRCKPAEVRSLVEELNKSYIEQGRAFEICEVAGGYQMRTLAEFAPYLQQTLSQRPLRLSQAALETLSIVAYRQPVTRAEVEHIRGVDAGAVLRSLLERKLVRVAGHREVPGRPMLYATTKRFLEVFELDRLEDLPTLRDLRELSAENAPAAAALRSSAAGAAEEGEPSGGEATRGEPADAEVGDAPPLESEPRVDAVAPLTVPPAE